jgi:hypothetical protein
MPKLNQIIAVEKGVKSRSETGITAVYHAAQKSEPFTGIARSYTPKDEDGDQLPAESTRVMVNVEDLLRDAASAWTDLIDVTLTKDTGNTHASASVVVDGVVILTDVPVTSLIFLEKKLNDVRSVLGKMPTLPADKAWHWDESQAAWATDPRSTVRTKKVMRNHVLAEATKEHAAQVQPYTEDAIEGTWTTIDYSGAMPRVRLNQLVARLDSLQDAVKRAREEANDAEVAQIKAGESLMEWLLA